MIYYWAWWIDKETGKLWLRGWRESLTELNSYMAEIGKLTGYETYESTHYDPTRVKAELRDVIAVKRGNLDMVTARFHSKIASAK